MKEFSFVERRTPLITTIKRKRSKFFLVEALFRKENARYYRES